MLMAERHGLVDGHLGARGVSVISFNLAQDHTRNERMKIPPKMLSREKVLVL